MRGRGGARSNTMGEADGLRLSLADGSGSVLGIPKQKAIRVAGETLVSQALLQPLRPQPHPIQDLPSPYTQQSQTHRPYPVPHAFPIRTSPIQSFYNPLLAHFPIFPFSIIYFHTHLVNSILSHSFKIVVYHSIILSTDEDTYQVKVCKCLVVILFLGTFALLGVVTSYVT